MNDKKQGSDEVEFKIISPKGEGCQFFIEHSDYLI